MTATAKKIRSPKYIFLILFICSAAYMVSYLTRYNYAAVMVEIVKAENFSKTAASFPLTAMFIVYGAVQLLSGYLGDKIDPDLIVFTGLLGTAIANVAMPFCPSPYMMTVVWGINGFFQSLLWPPIVRILTDYLTKEDYGKYIVYVLFGTGFGTIFVYSFTPVILAKATWKEVFYIPAAIAFAMAFIWILSMKKIESHAEETEIQVNYIKTSSEGKLKFTTTAIFAMGLVMAANVMQGFLRDGTANWMPTYMDDVFHLGSKLAILTGVALPIASKVVSFVTNELHHNVFKNIAITTSVFFGVCAASCLVLTFFHNFSGVLAVCMLMIANSATHAVNYVYTTIVITNFERFNRASFVAGLLNSFVYVGSALSTYGIAYIEKQSGWVGVMVSWSATSILGFVICLFSIRHFKKEL